MQVHSNESTNTAAMSTSIAPNGPAEAVGVPECASLMIALKPDDISSFILWLDGMAKFIDITKAHLPDLYDSKVILMQRLSRHTFELKKRLQDARSAASAPQAPTGELQSAGQVERG